MFRLLEMFNQLNIQNASFLKRNQASKDKSYNRLLITEAFKLKEKSLCNIISPFRPFPGGQREFDKCQTFFKASLIELKLHFCNTPSSCNL